MMRLAVISISMLATATMARAEPTFYNATSMTLTVEATFPNGKVEKHQVSDGSEAVSSNYFAISVGVQKLAIKIYDDVGTELWKGNVGANDVHLTIPDGKRTKTIFAGLYSGSSGTPKASVFMNLTGEPISLDLEGVNGVGAHRGIKPGMTFDLKQSVRLDPKESYFTVLVKGKAGEPVKLGTSTVTPGRYYAIAKHPRDTYRLIPLGHLAPPATAKRK